MSSAVRTISRDRLASTTIASESDESDDIGDYVDLRALRSRFVTRANSAPLAGCAARRTLW